LSSCGFVANGLELVDPDGLREDVDGAVAELERVLESIL
jgi:hypothetical protein